MQHDDSKQPAPEAERGSTGARVMSPSRRALLRAGTAAAPVVLTLASGPVSATSTCVLASSFVSATVYKSRNPGAGVINCSTMTVAQCVTAAQAARVMNSSGTVSWGTGPMSVMVAAHFATGTGNLPAQTVGALFHQGAVTAGANGVLQRLVAISLGGGATRGFSPLYATMVWNRYHGVGGSLASLLNTTNIAGGTPGGGWDEARLLKWLDYLLNPTLSL